MLAFLLTLLFSFLLTTLFGYVVHWALHQNWSGSVHVSHMTHHLKLYPPEDFSSETYRDAGKDNSFKFFALAAIPLIIIPIALWCAGILSLGLMLVVLLMEALMGFLHDYLHDVFHISNHWLSRTPILKGFFAKWVKLHYQHHVDMKTNYGIFSFLWDKILGTFVK
jgi:sterol desaturase/sphingolipid hydroxylase (fatty acid hydroxylase superfamily)